MQIGTMNMEERGVVQARTFFRQWNTGNLLPRVPIPANDCLRQKRDLAQRISQTQRLQHLDSIRGDLNTGPDLSKRTCPLERMYLNALTRKRTREGNTSNTAANHADPKFPSHLAHSAKNQSQ